MQVTVDKAELDQLEQTNKFLSGLVTQLAYMLKDQKGMVKISRKTIEASNGYSVNFEQMKTMTKLQVLKDTE